MLIRVLAVTAAAFHLYAAGVAPFTALVQRPVHLALMAALAFLGLGVGRERGGGEAEPPAARARQARAAVGAALIAATLFTCTYLVLQHEALVRRSGMATPLDLVAGGVAIVIVLELARRTTGWALVAVALLALGYAFAGPYLPGMLAHRGYSLTRVIEHLYLSTEGIWGIPLGVSADFVYLFVLFGALLDAAGGGELLIALASRVAGATRGGPAKTAVVASGLMGSLSGSAVANVVTTGSVTIPLMKRTGFQPHFAGAVEAAASTGGQIMPPVMGAGAFILATWTNIPYLRVALASLVPAILYYVALFMAIHFRAEKMNIPPTGRGAGQAIQPRLHLLLSLGAIVLLLALGRSPQRAAFWGVVTAAAATLVRPETRLGRGKALDTLVAAGAGTVQVAAACATAGIVVGVASLTGIGLRMSEFIITLSHGSLPVALLLTAMGSIVLGMGLPTTAAYVVLAALGAPALTDLGVPVLAAHLFIFYFGCISNVTPPVALAAYAAAGIADASPVRTGLTAMALAATGFIVPFMFIYGPPLLLVGEPLSVAMAIVTATIGVTALAAAVIGYARRPLAGWERALLVAAALMLIFPGPLTDGVGLGIVGLTALRRGGRAALEEAAKG
ncbi:MAG: TRAP transporter fused permease subunit [Gemmatimonadetes bacterium]|nr:TRAP transporter fused permease subunit [Gemmatimonadota bacterium]